MAHQFVHIASRLALIALSRQPNVPGQRTDLWTLAYNSRFQTKKHFLVHTLRTKNLQFWMVEWKLYITRKIYPLRKKKLIRYKKHEGLTVEMTSQKPTIYIHEMRCHFNICTYFFEIFLSLLIHMCHISLWWSVFNLT